MENSVYCSNADVTRNGSSYLDVLVTAKIGIAFRDMLVQWMIITLRVSV